MTTSVIPNNVRTAAQNGAQKIQVQDVKDPTHVGLLAVYLVQRLGRPTLEEIKKTARERLGANIDGRTLKRVLMGASRAGKSIAINQDRLPEDQGGAVVDVYSMKDPQRWRSPPEYAHLTDLLPVLLQDPTALEIKKSFDEQETGPAEKKARRGNDIDFFVRYSALIYTLDPLLGSQIHCPFTDRARGISSRKSEEKPEFEGIFVVDPLSGDRLLTADALNGWFATNGTRYAGLPEARSQYVGFQSVRISKDIKPIQLVLPVNNARQGASAPKSYEAIQPGQILKLEFTAPTKGFLSPEQVEKLLHLIGAKPRRGLSPARGKRYGRFLVIGFKNHGPVTSTGIDFVLDELPPEVLKQMGRPTEDLPKQLSNDHYRYMADAVERLKNVDLRSEFKPSAADAATEEEDE